MMTRVTEGIKQHWRATFFSKQTKIMFRFTKLTNLVTTRSLLYRRKVFDNQGSSISISPPLYKKRIGLYPQEREPCAIPPPPPPPPPKDDKAIWSAITLLFLAAGFAVYAKGNPEIRDWLTLRAPWFDDIIAIMFEENMTYKEFFDTSVEDITQCVKTILHIEKPLKPCEERKHPKVGPDPACRPGERLPIEKVKRCDPVRPPVITKNICDIEYCLKDEAENVYHNYMTARDVCVYYNKLVEDVMSAFTMPGLRELLAAKEERFKVIKEAMANACESNSALNELMRYLECGVQAPKDQILNTIDMVNVWRQKIKNMNTEYKWEHDKSLAYDEEVAKVQFTMEKYTGETQGMLIGLDYESERPTIRKSDVDLLLHHTVRFVDMLQEQLIDEVQKMSDRVNRGLQLLPQGDAREKWEPVLQRQIAAKKAELDKYYAQRLIDQKNKNEFKLKQKIKEQTEKHDQTVEKILEQKEKEANIKLEQMVKDKIAAERKAFAEELKDMAAKLKVVEDQLNARLKSEKEARRSQELWRVGAALLAATKKGDRFVNIEKEMLALKKATPEDDELVRAMRKSIPMKVKHGKGVVPESVLRERYYSMEKVALNVALVEQEGAPLPIYFISWLQSMLLFMRLSGIPQHEIDSPPKDFKDFDTFDLLQRARFFIERNDLTRAYAYVNALEGASKGAAHSWLTATKNHLMTKQAAEAIIAHACSLALQYL